MVGELVNASSNFLGIIPSSLVEQIEGLITVLWAVGILLLVYVAWFVVRLVLRWQDRRRFKRIEEKVDALLLRKQKNKHTNKRKKN